ncbi:MAG TPA: glycosyltransferase [Thermoplasmataceae archaeon]|nr:glycosyltransferase [Thermoplasmatales archaeon AK]HLH86413.1 glycosyltransferase [Thermoplasmataceae archaeon]
MESNLPIPISVVITVRNEARNIRDLLDSLVVQEGPFELVAVDSDSEDGTGEIILSYDSVFPVNYLRRRCSRGEGRNLGVASSRYDHIVFLDGDSVCDRDLLHSYRKQFDAGYELIAGVNRPTGKSQFAGLQRVKLMVNGFEITSPSSNLGYTKPLFIRLGGFDQSFVTAEDIDLNFRAVTANAKFTVCENCVAFVKTRNSYTSFMKQAFWNGYGRGQLRLKHRRDWNLVQKAGYGGGSRPVQNALRLLLGSLGYVYAILRRGKYPFR